MEEFLESTALHECSFGLIDPAIVEFVPSRLKTQVLVPQRLRPSRHLMPILLDLRYLSDDSRQCLLSWHREVAKCLHLPAVAFFITTPIDADEFSRHWNVMQLAQPTSTHKFWFRIHDPRVLHQLLRIINPAQRRRLFGRSQVFHYWVGESWVAAPRDLKTDVSLLNKSVGFAGWDWRRIERIGIVNRVMLRAKINDAIALATKADLVEQLIERAEMKHGLTNQADLVEFAARALQTTLNFDEHPAVARAIEMTANSTEEASLADHFSLIEEQVWEMLGHFANRSMEYKV